jgi:hypothetical protein
VLHWNISQSIWQILECEHSVSGWWLRKSLDCVLLLVDHLNITITSLVKNITNKLTLEQTKTVKWNNISTFDEATKSIWTKRFWIWLNKLWTQKTNKMTAFETTQNIQISVRSEHCYCDCVLVIEMVEFVTVVTVSSKKLNATYFRLGVSGGNTRLKSRR